MNVLEFRFFVRVSSNGLEINWMILNLVAKPAYKMLHDIWDGFIKFVSKRCMSSWQCSWIDSNLLVTILFELSSMHFYWCMYIISSIAPRQPRQFKSWPSQTSSFQNSYLSISSLPFGITRIEHVKGWFAQYQDNVTESEIESCCRWPDLPVGQHYKVTMNAHCHKSVPVVVWL